jgi:hypothetical protein
MDRIFLFRTHLNFLFFSENELVFFQMRQFLKGIASLLPRKLTKYEEIRSHFLAKSKSLNEFFIKINFKNKV